MDIFDYHVHSDNSFDGKEKIINISKRAIDLGISEICFTEHYSVDPTDVSFGILDYNKYSNEIKECQEISKNKITIKKGLEIGEPYLSKGKINECTKNMDLDFIIGSVHNIDNHKLRLYIKGREKKDIYNRYFTEIYNMVKYGGIDVVGHLDLMKRYAYKDFGNYDFNDYRDVLYIILEEMVKNNVGIEVNTSGLRDDVKETYPSIEVIRLYKQLGGENITIGSDTHSCEYIGNNFSTVIGMLKEVGFKYIFKYEKRKSTGITIK